MESIQDPVDTVGGLRISTNEYFKHTPLDHTKRSIRLVRILPRLSTEALIQCEISHATTDASYECLSYRWGQDTSQHEILLNGKRFRVRQNLFDFLEHMRLGFITSAKTTQLIWIDALCIDQSSIDERNHQVAQMGVIFQGATVVRIWLGKCIRLCRALPKVEVFHYPDKGRFLYEKLSDEEFSEDEFSDEGFRLPNYLDLKQTNGETSPLLVQIYRIYGSKMSFLSTHKICSWEMSHYLGFRAIKLQERLAVLQQILEAEFFNNKYWSRAWITQEIFVARHAVVMLEKEELSIAACINVLWGCNKAAVHDNKIVNKFASYLGFDNSGLPSIQLRGTSKSFLSLLRQFSDKNCAIPRDRLYSLLSLYSDGGKVAVDYAQPDDELLCHVAKCLYEPVGLCSIINLARSLMPQSESLGIGFIDIDLLHLVLEWEPADAFICQHIMSRAQSQYTFRKLLNVKFSKTSCIFLPKVLEVLHGRATLIESWPTAEEEPDFACYGERMMAVSTSESGAQFDDIMPRSGKNVDPSTLRMYAHDFGIWMANKEDNIWTVRIRLSLLWEMFGTANAKELCNSLHRFSYGGICTHVRLGCAPLHLGLTV